MQLRFATNADRGSVERLSISCLRPEYGAKPKLMLDLKDLCPEKEPDAVPSDLLPPHQIFLVKGWTRVFCMYTVLAFIYENHAELKEEASSMVHGSSRALQS